MTTTNIEPTRLSGVFFAPNYNEMLPFMIEAHKSFKYKSDAKPNNRKMDCERGLNALNLYDI